MSDADWHDSRIRGLAVFLNGHGLTGTGPRLEQIIDNSFLLLFNPTNAPIDFQVPDGLGGETWRVVLDTNDRANRGERVASSDRWTVAGWGTVLLQREELEETH